MSLLPPKLPRFVPNDRYTLEQWIHIEESTGKRYEYHDGQLISFEAMAGGSHEHARVAGNVIREVGNAIIAAEKGRPELSPCDSLTSDLRIAVDGGRRYLYADAVVVCGDPKYDKTVPSAIVNPVVVFEVISPSSDGYDRGLKFEFYGVLASLREYIIVEQETRRMEVRHRETPDSPWVYTVVTDVNVSAALPSMGLSLPMAGVYRNWQPPKPR